MYSLKEIEPLVHTKNAFQQANAWHSKMPRENEINIKCVIVQFYRLFWVVLSNGKIYIYEKSFQVTRNQATLTCDCTIIISYTKSNKNINKKYEYKKRARERERYLRINFIFTAITYAMCVF